MAAALYCGEILGIAEQSAEEASQHLTTLALTRAGTAGTAVGRSGGPGCAIDDETEPVLQF